MYPYYRQILQLYKFLYIIAIIQLNNLYISMNFYTPLLAHPRISPITPLPYLNSQAFQRQNIIRLLSISLKNSILSYQLKLTDTITQPPIAPAPAATPKPTPPLKTQQPSQAHVIHILSDEQQELVRNSIIKNKQQIYKKSQAQKQIRTQKKIVIEKPKIEASIIQINAQLNVKNIGQKGSDLTATTNQEICLSSQQIVRGVGKTKVIKKSKPFKPDFYVEVPKINLVDFCDLPQQRMKKLQIDTKRQCLLRRRVCEWVYKSKKPKRQIRNLDH